MLSLATDISCKNNLSLKCTDYSSLLTEIVLCSGMLDDWNFFKKSANSISRINVFPRNPPSIFSCYYSRCKDVYNHFCDFSPSSIRGVNKDIFF